MYKRENILLKEKKKRKRKGSIKRIATVTVTVIATKQNTTTKALKPKRKKFICLAFHFSYRFISLLLARLFVFCNGDNVKVYNKIHSFYLYHSDLLCLVFAKPFFIKKRATTTITTQGYHSFIRLLIVNTEH